VSEAEEVPDLVGTLLDEAVEEFSSVVRQAIPPIREAGGGDYCRTACGSCEAKYMGIVRDEDVVGEDKQGKGRDAVPTPECVKTGED
jgi:hypothetical protein